MPTWGSFTWGSGVTWGGPEEGGGEPPSAGYAPLQILFGDLTIGPGGPYIIEDFQFSAADVEVEFRGRPQGTGLHPAQGRFRGRHHEWKFSANLHDHADALDAANRLSAHFAVSDEVVPLVWREAGTWWRIHGQPQGVEQDRSVAEQGFIGCKVRFVQTDPNVYVDTLRQLTVPAKSKAVFSWPISWPLHATAVNDGLLEVTNDGTGDGNWAARIAGPCRDPIVARIDTGQVLAFTGKVLAGDALVLDSESATARPEGESVLRPFGAPRWWRFPPGDTPLRFSTSDGAGQLTMAWRDAMSA